MVSRALISTTTHSFSPQILPKSLVPQWEKKKKSNLRERREMFKMLHSPLRSTEHIIMLLSRNDLDPLILMREKISSSRNILALIIKGTSGLPRWLNGRVNLPKQET